MAVAFPTFPAYLSMGLSSPNRIESRQSEGCKATRTSKDITARVHPAYLGLLRNGELTRVNRYRSDGSSRMESEPGAKGKRALRRLWSDFCHRY